MFDCLYLTILCVMHIRNGPRCVINSLLHFNSDTPIIVKNGSLLEPTNRNGDFELQSGEEITISCEGASPQNIYHPNAVKENITTSTIKCEGGCHFHNKEWLTNMAEFERFRCFDSPVHRSSKTSRKCYSGNPIIEVGYNVQERFYAVYESCFDETNLTPIYSKYTQRPYNVYFKTRVPRPFFIDDGVYDVSVEAVFYATALKRALRMCVGKEADNYEAQRQELSRGHLASKTDFVYAFGQRATFHYVNCAPQWKDFNGGNWNTLEVDLRIHIGNVGYDTVIYTGTYGVLSLRNDSGHETSIYLERRSNGQPVIPVPLYFYKLVYEPSTCKGVAFVGINNPFYTYDQAKELFFCKDVCTQPQYSWLTWHPNNSREGYSFCCTVPDFQNFIPHIPRLEYKGLLT